MSATALSREEAYADPVEADEETRVAEEAESEGGGRAFYVVTTLAVVLMGLFAASSLVLVVYAHILSSGMAR